MATKSIAQVELSQTRTLVSSVLLSRPRLQAVILPLLAVAMQATGDTQAHQEEPAPRVGRVHTKCRRATSHARIVHLSRPLLLGALLNLPAVAMQATGAMQAHQEEPAPRVGRVHTRRRRATSHARIVHLSRPLLLAALLYLPAVAMQATGAMQAHQEESASCVVRGSTRRRRAT
jgi:hypothetical protein